MLCAIVITGFPTGTVWCGVSMKAVEFSEWRVAGAGVEESNVKTIKVKLEEIFFASFFYFVFI